MLEVSGIPLSIGREWMVPISLFPFEGRLLQAVEGIIINPSGSAASIGWLHEKLYWFKPPASSIGSLDSHLPVV